jgi:hypothetical protein
LAFGRLRLTPAQFGDMTPREFSNMVQGYAEGLEQDSRERWEQARMVAYYSVAAHVKKGKTMQAVIPLPWDRPAYQKNPFADFPERPTDEQLKALSEKLERNIMTWQTLSALS